MQSEVNEESSSIKLTSSNAPSLSCGSNEETDEMPAASPMMARSDSFFAAHLEGSNGDESSFSVVEDKVLHEPPVDMQAFFSIPAKQGKYLTLIQQLLHPHRPSKEQQAKGEDAAAPTPSTPAVGNTTSAASPTAAATYLTKQMVEDVCRDVTAVLTDEASLLQIAIQPDDTLVVVGDVHGQFHDMIHHVLSQQFDKPAGTPDRKFLFLGDYVDRGPQGVETILLLFALKIEYPSHIFLLRGNHEEAQTSRIYGFLFEVRTKFNDLAVWARFNEVFCFLPLAAIVSTPDHRFFAVHGGLSPALTDVSVISKIERTDYGGMLDNTESDIVDGLLWSDPSENIIRFSRNERGCGYLFGPAATAEFCEENNLDFICRAHQMTMQGYAWTHTNRVLTVFSAPNYCGVTNNLASIMLVNYNWDLNFVKFAMAPNRQPMSPPSTFSAWGGMSYFN